jgi:parvulin-like peptidyl-prolyl isomerase
MKRVSFAFASTSLAVLFAVAAVVSVSAPAVADDVVFATVDGVEISRNEYEREVYSAARKTFYHGQPPSGEEFIEFRKGVADKMIVRQLLLKEADRRQLEPDRGSIEARLAVYEERYGDTERWQTEGEQMVAALRERFEQDSVLESLEASVREVGDVDPAAVRQFYEEHPELFTQPAQNRVSLILLGVPASATPAMWKAARDEADRVMQELESGAPFEELASLHSADLTAQAGGDMGYVHQGTLGGDAERAIQELDVGEVSEPIQVLEGMAIFKLTGRKPSQLHSFEEVRQRATDLWMRDAGEQQWNVLVAELRAASEVSVDSDYIVTLPEYVE